MQLKSQDLLVLLKQVAHPTRVWTYSELGEALLTSASQAHRSVQRCLTSQLAVPTHERGGWQTVRSSLLEFLVHGVRYAFPASLGAVRRGIPTSFGYEPLSAHISSAPGESPVWAHAQGTVRGPSLSPLCRNAPDVALGDPAVHQMLALVDALRMGRARERRLAAELLGEELSSAVPH